MPQYQFKEVLVDLDVWKNIVALWKCVDEPANDVLRRVFNLPDLSASNGKGRINARTVIGCKGGSIPDGTKLRGTHKGREVRAEVRAPRIYVEGDNQPHRSPSAAARSVTKYSVNGWRFWEYETSPGRWEPLQELRTRSGQSE